MNPDFSDLLRAFNAERVEYLVVGGYALAAHGHVRATKELDVWVRPDRGNARRVMRALVAFGAPLHDLSEDDLETPGVVFQIGVPPVRIDILTQVTGVEFAAAWRDRFMVELAGDAISVLSLHHLIANKQACGRLQDLADVEELQRLVGSAPSLPPRPSRTAPKAPRPRKDAR